MKKKKTILEKLIVGFLLLAFSSLAPAEEVESSKLPYIEIWPMISLSGKVKVGAEEYAVLYLKPDEVKTGYGVDVVKINLVMPNDGGERELLCELLSAVPEAELTAIDKEKMEEGITHRIWIPVNEVKYSEALIVANFKKGSAELSAVKEIPFKIKLSAFPLKGKISLPKGDE